MNRAVLALQLLQLTGPDRQVVEINPAEIVALRAPRHAEHFAKGTRCLVYTSDGKHLAVVETCSAIRAKLKGE